MRYMRIEENAMDHPKFIALNAGAWRLWCEGGTYCQKHLTDGFIPSSALKGFRYFSQGALKQLVEAMVPSKGPLWHKVEGGIQVHDYLDHNESREKVLKMRTDAKERLDRWKAEQAAKRDGKKPPATPPGNALQAWALNGPKRNRTEQSVDTEHQQTTRARGAGSRGGVGAGSFPGDHLDHLACGPVCFTPRMTAKFIGRFGADRERLAAWAARVCERESERVEAGHPVVHGDDFAYWTAAYDADFAAPKAPAPSARAVPGAESTDDYLTKLRAARG